MARDCVKEANELLAYLSEQIIVDSKQSLTDLVKTYASYVIGTTPSDMVELPAPEVPPEPMLSADQQAAWDKIVAWIAGEQPYFVLRGHAGTGKEQPLSCMIQTINGPRRLGSLKLGDKIYGQNGELTTVTGIHPQGRKPAYRIKFRDGTHTYCGLNHLWKISDKHGRERVVPTSLFLEEGLCNTAGFRYRVPLCAPINYPKRKLPLHPYFMGVLLGNGSFRSGTMSISNHVSDIEIIERIESFEDRFDFNGRHTSNKGVQFNIVDPEAKAWVQNRLRAIIHGLGLLGLKSDKKFIPEIYLLSSIEDRWELLRGLMDTDGCRRKNGGSSYSTYSNQLAKDICRLTQSLGGMAIDNGGRDREHDINIKTFENPFHLKRKAARWRLSHINHPVRGIADIEYVRDVEQMCITVSAKDHLYLTDNFIVTHNTHMLRKLAELKVGIRYSATTNKAAKVLSISIGELAKTTYSVLGLRLTNDEDQQVLKQAEVPPYIARGTILVIDECSMVGTQLFEAVEAARKRSGIRVLFVGDPAQLPPVKENKSPVWFCTKDLACLALMRQVMRNDNALLKLATDVRECLRNGVYETPMATDYKDGLGVHVFRNHTSFEKHLLNAVAAGDDLHETKVLAWRNKSVDRYNALIRQQLGFKQPYCVGDVILLAEPIEKDGKLIAHTDDELAVAAVADDMICIEGLDIDTWQIDARGDTNHVLQVPKDWSEVDRLLSEKARRAREHKHPMQRRMAWKDFWETKARFNRIRYGYALTAHRSQGSTYTTTFVDQEDILANPNKREAFRCLYVAVTRSTKALFSY